MPLVYFQWLRERGPLSDFFRLLNSIAITMNEQVQQPDNFIITNNGSEGGLCYDFGFWFLAPLTKILDTGLVLFSPYCNMPWLMSCTRVCSIGHLLCFIKFNNLRFHWGFPYGNIFCLNFKVECSMQETSHVGLFNKILKMFGKVSSEEVGISVLFSLEEFLIEGTITTGKLRFPRANLMCL